MNIIGNQKQRDFLFKISKQENMQHAFLFSGDEMIGKKQIAIEFARNLACGCGECKNCINFEKLKHPDLFFLSKEKEDIKIEELRDLQNFLNLKPYSAKKKIAIIENVHLMKKDGQNSILKTLEEPTDNSVLILITHLPEMLLGTIKSRVQRINFSPLNRKEINAFLISRGADKEEAEEISLYSSGKIGKALELFEDKDKKDFLLKTMKDIQILHRSDFEKRFEYVKNIYEDKEKINEFLDIFERFLRRTMLLKIFKRNSDAFSDFSILKIKETIEEIQKTKYYLNYTNTNKRLLLDNLIIKI